MQMDEKDANGTIHSGVFLLFCTKWNAHFLMVPTVYQIYCVSMCNCNHNIHVIMCQLLFTLFLLFHVVSGRNKKGICISQQSLVNFLNKSAFQFPLFLSLERVQLSDMVSHP